MPTKKGRKWQAHSKRGGRAVYLGGWNTWEEARLAEIEYEVAWLEDERERIEQGKSA